MVADLELKRGPPAIKSEAARPNAWVYVDLKTSDIGGFVADAKKVLERKVDVPSGYTVTWSGQFEYMERAAERLRIVVPVTLLIVFLLLYFHIRNLTGPVIVMLSLPFAVIGGIWIVYLLDYNMSVAVAVGFIALAGVAAEVGVLVLTFIDAELKRQRDANVAAGRGPALSREQIGNAVFKGTAERVRSISMTAIAVVGGLAPIMIGTGTGSEVMQRIAAPMVGGMLTVTILGLVVLPAVYDTALLWKERRQTLAEVEVSG